MVPDARVAANAEIYREQAFALIEGGADLLIIETSQDILELKAAIAGGRAAMRESGRVVPIQAQVTLDTSGRMLMGTDIGAAMVIMEAMGFRTPMVTTDVHGIAEMVGQRQEGYLVPPGDHVALSKMMGTCLAKERSGKSLTPTAYSKALRYYDYDKVLPYHVELAQESVLAHE